MPSFVLWRGKQWICKHSSSQEHKCPVGAAEHRPPAIWRQDWNSRKQMGWNRRLVPHLQRHLFFYTVSTVSAIYTLSLSLKKQKTKQNIILPFWSYMKWPNLRKVFLMLHTQTSMHILQAPGGLCAVGADQLAMHKMQGTQKYPPSARQATWSEGLRFTVEK